VNPISVWKNDGADYFEGLELCRKYLPEGPLMKLLETGESSLTRKKMLKALGEIEFTATLDAERVDPLQRKLKLPEYDYFNLPESLQEKHKMKGQLYKDAGKLHAQLWYLQGKELEDAAGAIVTMMRANQQLWEELDFYHEHGELPRRDLKLAVPEIEGLKDVEVPTRIAREKAKLSDRKKKLTTTVKDNERRALIKEINILEAYIEKLRLREKYLLEQE